MLEVQKIYTHNLELGMYVSSLDRDWLGTPFLIQGFLIESVEEIQQLQEHCQFVYIDDRRSKLQSGVIAEKVSAAPLQGIAELFAGRTLKDYSDSASWADEFPRADSALEALSQGLESLFDEAAKGQSLDLLQLRKPIEAVIDSIVRNPDACIWLVRLKQPSSYTHRHSLGACVWAIALGRQIGLPRSDLRSLAIGGLLFDIGKLRIAPELLSAERPLSVAEHEQVRQHVYHGVDLVNEAGLLNRDVIAMVNHHHERHDGSGYPDGLSGSAIPVFARMASIIDCFDAVTSHRPYAAAIAPAEAIKLLNERKGSDFQPELVEQFVQAIGMYPAGSLVELNSGEVAVVVSDYRSQRLRPKVRVLLDAAKQPAAHTRLVDLSEPLKSVDGRRLTISRPLESQAYGIDIAAIKF